MADENEVLDDVQIESDDDLEVVVDESEDEVEAPAESETDAQDDSEDSDDEDSEDAAEDDEEPVEDSAETDDEPVEDSEPMPVKFKKRLDREIRLRDQIRAERDQIKQAAVQVANLAQQRDQEVAHLKKQNAVLQRQFAETLDYAYEKDITAKANELRRAREDGNYDAELKVQSELDQLRFQHNQVRQAKTTLPDPESIQVPQFQPLQTQQPAQQQPQREPPAPLAVKWINTNSSWFNNEKFAAHRAFVLTEDTRLAREGYDKNSPAYYKELDRRIDKAFPTLRKKRQVSSSPVAPASSSPARNTSSNTVRLTKADLNNMRMFGLDPSNKEHLREYARSKRAA